MQRLNPSVGDNLVNLKSTVDSYWVRIRAIQI